MSVRLLPPMRAAKLRGKRVLLRADFNVPVDRRGRVTDTFRIEAVLPTLRDLLSAGASVVVLAHRGRPQGHRVANLSLAPVAPVLARRLRRPVRFVPDTVGPKAKAAARALRPGEVLVLENLRFEAGEDAASPGFARRLARLGDAFIFDAFGTAHRRTATTWTLKALLPSFAGRLVQREVAVLSRVLHRPRRPLAVFIGGAKIRTKLGLLAKLLPHADHIFLGGALANTLLAAQGIQVGRSFVEPDLLPKLRRLQLTDARLHLPVDVVVSRSIARPVAARRAPVGGVRAAERIVDIGPDTSSLLARIARSAGTVVWNGPMGIYEVPAFARATRALARALARSRAVTVVGGGETLDAIRSQRLGSRFTHRSSGGGAMLTYLEGRAMPGLELPPRSHPPIPRRTRP